MRINVQSILNKVSLVGQLIEDDSNLLFEHRETRSGEKVF